MSKVSVCMATYNGSQYIGEQINSILKQLGDNDELIISDDSSTDNTVSIIKGFNDNRVVLYENQKFANHIFNFEFALSKAEGDYIFLSDQDDVWFENKVSRSIAELQTADLALSDCMLIDKNGNTLKASFFEGRKSNIGFWKNFHKNSYTGCCIAVKKEIIKKALPFPNKIISHDTWIGLVAEMFGKTALINEPLVKLRRHNDNVSVQSGNDNMLTHRTSYPITTIIHSRIYLFYNLAKRYLSYKV